MAQAPARALIQLLTQAPARPLIQLLTQAPARPLIQLMTQPHPRGTVSKSPRVASHVQVWGFLSNPVTNHQTMLIDFPPQQQKFQRVLPIQKPWFE